MENVIGASKPESEVLVNGSPVRFDDPVVTGRELLTAAGLLPASEFVLIQVRKGRTRLITTDDKVDLRDPGDAFRAFPSDRAFAFTVDEVGQIWGSDSIDVDELLAIMRIPEGRNLVLEREDEPDIVLHPGGTLFLGAPGVEDIVSRPNEVSGFVQVTIYATAGVFPNEGALRVRLTTTVGAILERAARALELGDTTGWVASVNGRDIDPALSFEQNHLSGVVQIEWSPREGGGGAHA